MKSSKCVAWCLLLSNHLLVTGAVTVPLPADCVVCLYMSVYVSVSVCLCVDLANMYTLLSPIHNGLSVLVRELEEFIKQTAVETVRPLLINNVWLHSSVVYSLHSLSLCQSVSLRVSLSVCLLVCLSHVVLVCISVAYLSSVVSQKCTDKSWYSVIVSPP